MKLILVVGLLSILSSVAFAQDGSREQKLQQFESLNAQIRAIEAQIRALEGGLIEPDESDIARAKSEGFEAVRLMPRETYDHKLSAQGGGAYYSFSTGSHDYQKIAQIELQVGNLSVGFAGADYGFIADLGMIPLGSVSKGTPEISFLVNYKPPTLLAEIRKEQAKSHKYETDTATYTRDVTASIGHVYALRAISFNDADVLVGLKVIRKDADGSLIIFWKKILDFPKPTIERDQISTVVTNSKL